MTGSTILPGLHTPVSSENDTQAAETMLSVLTFTSAGQRYGLSVMDVVQIIEMVTITCLPNTPTAIKGIINVRGQIVPVLDLRLRFGLAAVPYRLHTPIILVDYQTCMMGIVVDQMGEVLTLTSNNLMSVEMFLPTDLLNFQTDAHRLAFLAGVGQLDRQMIPILHLPAILSNIEYQQLSDALARQQTSEAKAQ